MFRWLKRLIFGAEKQLIESTVDTVVENTVEVVTSTVDTAVEWVKDEVKDLRDPEVSEPIKPKKPRKAPVKKAPPRKK